jgi:hypothetical protein
MTVDELVTRLAKPIMVYRFAKAQHNRKGANLRMVNAMREIELIVQEYCMDRQTMGLR